MIEQFRELKLDAKREDFLALREAMINVDTASWPYLKDRELDFSPGGTSVLFAHRDGILPNADLSVAWYGGQVTIGNIVPENLGQLSMAEYNDLFVDFYRARFAPAAAKLGLQPELTEAHRDLSEWISVGAVRQLVAFSNLANKGTGASHPNDRQRWLDFIIRVHDEGRRLPSEILEKWLIDELHWPESIASDLAIEFGGAAELLKRYDETR